MARRPLNRRMAALENSAETTARAMCRDPRMKVIATSGIACFDHTKNVMYVTAPAREPEHFDHPFLPTAFRGILDHECAHKLHTDFDASDAAVEEWRDRYGNNTARRVFGALNIFEDLRVEKLHGANYRGVAHNLRIKSEVCYELLGGAETTNPEWSPSDEPEKRVGVWGALLNGILRVGAGQMQTHEAHPITRLLLDACRSEIDQGFAADTTEAAAEAATALWERVKSLMPPEPPPPPPPPPQPEGQPQPQDQDGEPQPQDGQGEPQDQDQDGEPQDGEPQDGEPQDGEPQSGKGEPQAGPRKQQRAGPQEPQEEPAESEPGEEPGDESEPQEGPQEPEQDESDQSGPEGDPETKDGDEPGEPEGEDQGDGDGDEGEPEESEPEESDQDGEPEGEPEPGDDAGDDGETDGEAVQSDKPGAGFVPHVDRDIVAEAMGGEWGEVADDQTVIGNKYIGQVGPMYTVHPMSKAMDRHVRYGRKERHEGRELLETLQRAGGDAARKLQNMMQGAIQASRTCFPVGGLEEGDRLDPDAIPLIAVEANGPAVYLQDVTAITESTYVMVLVDVSGSMGSSRPTVTCPVHGILYRRGRSKCQSGCREPLKVEVNRKAGYAAITAMAIHKALQGCRIPHAVMGYTTTAGVRVEAHRRPGSNYLQWSRASLAVEMHTFVESPGLFDDGSALPYITGRSCNLDGESVENAAKLAAELGGEYDRVILMVLADGLPAGCDDYRMDAFHLQDTVERVARAGIEVYGVAICTNYDDFKEFYPDREAEPGRAPTGSVEVKSGEGLTDEVLRTLTRKLTRGFGMSRRKAG